MSDSALDARIAAIAAQQYQVFARCQAMASGATSTQIDRRLWGNRWLWHDQSVYGLPGGSPSWRRELKIAELSVRGAAVSGFAAAGLHGLTGFGQCRPEITIAPLRSARSRLAVVHRSQDFAATTLGGISVFTVPQTIVDIAYRVSWRNLVRAVDDAVGARVLRPEAMIDRIAAVLPGRVPGAQVLRDLAERYAPDFVPTQSDLEFALEQLIEPLAIPRTTPQAPLTWWRRGLGRADRLISEWGLLIEVDGRRWHTRVSDFQSDRERDNLAQVHGLVVLRFSYDDVTQRPGYVVSMILEAGARRQTPPR